MAEDFSKRFGRPLVQALGIIELGLVCLNLDDPVRRWNSVGKPLPDYRFRILDAGSDGADAEEIRSFCRRYLTAFKVPIEIHFVDAVARTGSTGKILRRVHD